jgi:exodeoxyribonuclease V beta subunit
VALTRAEHRCILTAGHIKPISGGPLASMLWGDEAPEGEDRLAAGARRVEGWTRKEASAQDQEDMYQALSSWAQASPTLADASGIHSVSAQRCPPVLVRARWQPGPRERPALQTRHWEREGLDRTWRRHSYSSFVKSAGHAPLTVQQEAGLDLDQDVQEPTSSEPASPGPNVPLAAFPAGASPGIVLHEVLEKMDFVWAKTPEGAAAFDLLLGQILGSHGLLAHQEVLHQGLVQALLTPLGGPVGSLRLADLSRKDRLDELRFDMPLAGGDGHRTGHGDIKNGGIEGGGVVRGGDLIRALQTAPSQGVPLDYLKALTRRRWTDLSGFLNGAIDLIMRAPTEDGQVRWFVLDYKSNRLAPGSQKDVPVSTYRAPRLLEEMAHHDYHLQYHLYTLALHRFLKTRLPDYSYDRDVGGAYYLFVRGMVGPTQGEPQTGVIFARPSRSVIEAMDTLIGGSP